MTKLERLLLAIAVILTVWCQPFISGDRRFNLRRKVAAKVVELYSTNSTLDSFQGTGFHIVGPSGKIYIVTNRHVCEKAANGKVLVKIDNMNIEKPIISQHDTYDLCLVEAVYPTGLEMATDEYRGEAVAAVGHPSGYDTTMTQGEIVGYEPMSVNERITTDEQEKTCLKWKNHTINTVEDDDGNKVRVCTEVSNAILTTTFVKPGSSGSPVVDTYGNIVGVIYATESDDNWGRMVSLKQLKEFMKGR